MSVVKNAPQEKLRIAFATHAYENVDFDAHFNHMYCAAHWANMYDMYFIGRKFLQAADARNLIAKMAIEERCDWLFILDTDHIVTKNTLPLLLENKEEALVSGLICKKLYPYPQVVCLKNNKGEYIQYTLPLDGNLAEVAIAPFGCTLINIAKLQQLKAPYFRDTCRKGAHGNLLNFRSDINICEAFREAGMQVWVDTRVLVGHLGAKRCVYPQNAGFYKRGDEIGNELTNLRHGMVGDCNKFDGLTQ